MSTAISAKQVKDLRDQTGAGMMDCKKALEETAGDVEAAVTLAIEVGATSVDLTSRPTRESARLLYETMGFEERETTVYRKPLR